MRRYSALRGRRLSSYEAVLERIAASRAGAWLFLHVCNPVDRRLLVRTNGRVSLAVGSPVGVLETVGARSGQVRRTPLLHLRDGDRIVLVASNGGSPRHPAWLHNARARPRVRFLAPVTGWRSYLASEADAAERARLWPRLTDLYAGYAGYEQRTAGRAIPVVVLRPDPQTTSP